MQRADIADVNVSQYLSAFEGRGFAATLNANGGRSGLAGFAALRAVVLRCVVFIDCMGL